MRDGARSRVVAWRKFVEYLGVSIRLRFKQMKSRDLPRVSRRCSKEGLNDLLVVETDR